MLHQLILTAAAVITAVVGAHPYGSYMAASKTSSKHATSGPDGNVSVKQRLVPVTSDFFNPASPEAPQLYANDSFFFASFQTNHGFFSYFRSNLENFTFPVLLHNVSAVTPNLCALPPPLPLQAYRGPMFHAYDKEAKVLMFGGTGVSLTINTCTTKLGPSPPRLLLCFYNNGTWILQDGPLYLVGQSLGLAFEFALSGLENVVYREALGTIVGGSVDNQLEITSGWGGMDSYWGDYPFGGSRLFNWLEEEWLLYVDSATSEYGLLVTGTQGLAAGYTAKATSGSLWAPSLASITVDKTCYTCAAATLDLNYPQNGSHAGSKSFTSLATLYTLEGWGNWSLVSSPTSASLNGWWERHPLRN